MLKFHYAGYVRRCAAAASLLGMFVFAVTLSSCSGGRVYRSETFAPDSPYHHAFDATPEAACGAGRSALLSQGYVILESSEAHIKANKEFQPKEEIHNDLEVTITCEQHGSQAIVYANAVQQRYEVKKSRQSTSFSLPKIGALSLPGSSATEDLIKTGSETVTERNFYDRFFALVARLLEPVPRSQR
jgi:hypothetical protein